jgi:hypothetical protein
MKKNIECLKIIIIRLGVVRIQVSLSDAHRDSSVFRKQALT